MNAGVLCRTAAIFLFLATATGMHSACAQLSPPDAVSSDAPGTLALGGQVILRLRAAAGGLTPEQRVALIMNRVTQVVGFPHVQPSDVVIYILPAAKGQELTPVIYALGRRLITVDAATVQAAGGGQPLQLAKIWAKRLQQILPRVNWRPSNAPDTVVPPDPPLVVTHDLAQVGGNVGEVHLHDKLVIRLHGPQPGGWTAAERADILTNRLNRIAATLDMSDPNVVSVKAHVPNNPTSPVDLTVGGTTIITVDAAQAKAGGAATPMDLAHSWAKNIQEVLGIGAVPSAPVAPINPTAPTSPSTPAAPASPTTSPEQTPPTSNAAPGNGNQPAAYSRQPSREAM